MIILPGQNSRRKVINVDTANGTAVTNEQDWGGAMTAINVRQVQLLGKAHPKAQARTLKGTGVYNCHGLVFASRRTMISDSPEVRQIIADDGYQQITPKDVMPGDIVLYVGSDGDVEHSAVVVSLPDNVFSVVHVVSKWGLGLEYVHAVNDSPYDCTRLEYYRVNR